MFQPEPLQTDEHVPWAWGAGNEVWQMLVAAREGDLGTIQDLLRNSPNLVHSSYSYRNPFHFSVLGNQLEAARLLLDSGSKITFTNERWHTSAPKIAEEHRFEDLQQLIASHQLSKFQICSAGDTVGSAIESRDLVLVRQLIAEHGPEVADRRGNKPIHWAALTRQTNAIDLCIEAGADINAARPDGARAVDLTNGDYWYRGWTSSRPNAVKDHWHVVGYLLANGAHYDLTTACRLGDIERVRAIVSNDPSAANRNADYETWYSGFPLRSAAKAGHIEIVRYLLDSGADPNKPEHGLAPWGGSLFDAAQNGHTDVVELLLERGANPNQVVESSGSPLSIAENAEIKELLLQAGAEHDWFGCVYYNYPDDFRKHCEREPRLARDSELFMLAAENGHRELVEIFTKYDADIWTRMPANLGKSREITDWMFQSGMNVNQTNWLNSHRLHNDFDLDELPHWIERGVDLNLVDDEHHSTPLGMAARRGNLKQVRALLDAGADREAAGAEFAVPINWATTYEHHEVVKLLQN